MSKKSRVNEAKRVLAALGLPSAQQNERSALCLLALLDLRPDADWSAATDPLIGITPIMDWIRQHYKKDYVPNTRETVRRQTMHQFVQAGIALYNPDQPDRAVNSPRAAYQIAPDALALLRGFSDREWMRSAAEFVEKQGALSEQYARPREQNLVPVTIAPGQEVQLSPGEHSQLIRAVIEEFAPRFAPGSALVYAGDTGEKWGYFDRKRLESLGVDLDSHGKMPDVVLHYTARNWLLLVEAVTSHGPIDGKRHIELARVFADSTAGLVYVTAFPTRALMSRYLGEIAWETEVWVADAPAHLIHFNGERFLGPYPAA